jgi:hypothetical protein
MGAVLEHEAYCQSLYPNDQRNPEADPAQVAAVAAGQQADGALLAIDDAPED